MDFLCDYELLYLVRQQNEFALNALFLKYEKMLWSIIHQHTKHYPKVGFDEKDCMQYAYLSFHQSMSQYREDRNASFSTFAYTCVDRRIRTVLRDLFRGNNMFYSDCISMDQEIFSSENITLVETIENPYPEYCPVWNLQLKEEEETFHSHLVRIKKEEKEIFAMWRDGFSYSEIAQQVSCEMKYVDNVIQKIRKIRNKHMNNELIV